MLDPGVSGAAHAPRDIAAARQEEQIVRPANDRGRHAILYFSNPRGGRVSVRDANRPEVVSWLSGRSVLARIVRELRIRSVGA